MHKVHMECTRVENARKNGEEEEESVDEAVKRGSCVRVCGLRSTNSY